MSQSEDWLSLSDFPFPVQLGRVLTLKDVPSTLWSLVEVIAQHANQKAKKEKKKAKISSEFVLFITAY